MILCCCGTSCGAAPCCGPVGITEGPMNMSNGDGAATVVELGRLKVPALAPAAAPGGINAGWFGGICGCGIGICDAMTDCPIPGCPAVIWGTAIVCGLTDIGCVITVC